MEIINKMINKKENAYPKIFISGIDEVKDEKYQSELFNNN